MKKTIQLRDLDLKCGSFDGTVTLESSGSGNARESVFTVTGEQMGWLTVEHIKNEAQITLYGDHELEAFLAGMHELYMAIYK